MRKWEISFVNIILCLLVMWIHIASVAVTGLAQDSIQFGIVYLPWRLSGFVVQGFLFLSALKFFRGMEQRPFSYGNFLWSRCKKIIIPYIIVVLISYFGLISLHYYDTFDFRFFTKSLLLGNMIAPFYFITILVQFYLLMPLWRWMVTHIDFWIAAIASVLLMRLFHAGLPNMIVLISPDTVFPYNDRVFTSYLAYWVLGCYAGKHYTVFTESIQKNQKILFLGFIIFALADGLLSYGNTRGMLRASFLEDIHTLYVFAAIAALFAVALRIGERMMRFAVCQAIDGFSFYLYLYHGIFLYYVQDCLIGARGISIGTGLFLRMVLCYGMAVCVGLLVRWYRNRRKERKA